MVSFRVQIKFKSHSYWSPLSPGQTIATFPSDKSQHCWGATCCVRLATMLRRVGFCCVKFERGQIFHTIVDVV